ncbi:MAG TPA: DUF1858 domain-containing protein [Polyangiaceae bacterium]|jgi:uncharacterized protein (DUF2249 family)|nr:MAG: hypothetical protein BWY17_01468 [Deltaproteobacteria bacterium ADurb.Bin207]HNS96234.1 DUF1858 domain-containing protein [Polyangiaceae bacterium]HNZ20822.1 DUF1858 domain-containing protein [Polyangiaceae bacterium]HOD22646.1 DUF1858 domain-containing protein [Polyangiaceae bacterium]HOE48252.1 DUF1858 domain-containing protein [Polyangiaceae bacterium]
MANERLLITPDVRVAQLLEVYPELEAVLVSLSPTFQALKNPVLRRTVAKVATLRQVASVGGIGLGILINRLREAVGQEQQPTDAQPQQEPLPAPPWANPEQVTASFDARPLLDAGGHPMQPVLSALNQLAPGQVYLLITPFVPAPLVDMAEKKGYATYSDVRGDELVHTFFRRS